jgi:glycerol uptake facilitator protein
MEYLGEFVGTFVLVFINNGVVANVLLRKTKGNTNENWWLISFAAGIAVTLGIYAAITKSQAHLNPAVSITMSILGHLEVSKLFGYVFAQVLGGIVGALFVYLSYKKHFDETTDEKVKLACFSTGPAIKNRKWNIITEILATFMLVGGIIVITDGRLLIPLWIIPVLIGIIVMVLGVSLGGSTGFAMNPARDLGPRIMHSLLRIGDSDWGYAFVPIIGPIIGGIIGGVLFTIYLGGL